MERGPAGLGRARHGKSEAWNLARRGEAGQEHGTSEARNKGGHIRKNNKPTQPNGTNTQQSTHGLCGPII